MTNEKKDNVQISGNPFTNNSNFNNLRSPMMNMRPIVQRTVNLSDMSTEAAAVVSLSQKRVSNGAAAYMTAAMSGVDESLFMAD